LTASSPNPPTSLLSLPDDTLLEIFEEVHQDKYEDSLLCPSVAEILINKRIYRVALPVWQSKLSVPRKQIDRRLSELLIDDVRRNALRQLDLTLDPAYLHLTRIAISRLPRLSHLTLMHLGLERASSDTEEVELFSSKEGSITFTMRDNSGLNTSFGRISLLVCTGNGDICVSNEGLNTGYAGPRPPIGAYDKSFWCTYRSMTQLPDPGQPPFARRMLLGLEAAVSEMSVSLIPFCQIPLEMLSELNPPWIRMSDVVAGSAEGSAEIKLPSTLYKTRELLERRTLQSCKLHQIPATHFQYPNRAVGILRCRMASVYH
jgi:hypothetical protein